MELSPDEAYAHIDKVASQHYQWGDDSKTVAGVLKIDALSLINVKFDALTKAEKYECQCSRE